MKPDTHTVQELFERDVRYVVPLYQRPYVWDREHQWQLLWDDIREMLDHQALGTSEMWTHFLGAIVLETVKVSPGHIPQYIVIDGQQRLTTLQLILAAASRSLGAVGADGDADLVAELTVNNPLKVKTDTDKLKVYPTNANRVAFTWAMSGNGKVPDDPKNKVQEAAAFFEARTLEYLLGDEADEEASLHDEADETAAAAADSETVASAGSEISDGVESRAELLRLTLTELMKIVSITLEEDDNAQVIFETLNARGTDLNALDLTKNAVFGEAQRQQLDTDSLYWDVWEPQLDQAYWRAERRQGRLNRPVGELFLMHWLVMKTRDLVQATELFPTFRRRVLASSTDASALIHELCDDAAVMRGFDDQKEGSPERQFFNRFAPLDTSVILPLILLLFRSPEIALERRRRALRMLESWLTRRALMRLTTKNYNRMTFRLVARLSADLEHADDLLLDALIGGEGDISRWPGDDELRTYLMTRDMYYHVASVRLSMVLTATETSLYSSKVEIPTVPGPLSIEHLMPQEWTNHWEIIGPDGKPLTGASREAVEEQRWLRLHRLGNLTIVTGGLNSSMSDAPWPQKRDALNKNSKLLLNAELAAEPVWDLAQIDQRTELLAERILRIWPGPNAELWPSTTQ